MAYCNECGAYIPDGHSKCLACGYDAAEAARKAAEEAKQPQAYEYKYEEPRKVDTDFLKEQLEKQRKRQQENSRKWAETEKAQREHAKNRNYSSATRSTDAKKYEIPTNFSIEKILSALSYFGMLFILPYIFCDKDDFAKFHAKQGMILFIASIVADIAASIFGLGWIVGIAKLYFIYKGVSNVLNGRKLELPYIGNLL